MSNCQVSLSLSISEYLKIEIKEGINFITLYLLCSEQGRWCESFIEFWCSPEHGLGQEIVYGPCLGLLLAPGQKLPEVGFVLFISLKLIFPKFLFMADLRWSTSLASLIYQVILNKVLLPGLTDSPLWILPLCF